MARLGMARLGMGTSGSVRKLMETNVRIIEESPEIKTQVEALREFAKDLKRGDVLKWVAVESLLGMDKDSAQLRYVVYKWRRFMHKEVGIETWPVPAVGMKLLTDEENLTVAAQKRTRRAGKQHRMVLRAMRNTRSAKLTDHQRLQMMAITAQSQAAQHTSRQIVATAGNEKSDRDRLMEMVKGMHDKQ